MPWSVGEIGSRCGTAHSKNGNKPGPACQARRRHSVAVIPLGDDAVSELELVLMGWQAGNTFRGESSMERPDGFGNRIATTGARVPCLTGFYRRNSRHTLRRFSTHCGFPKTQAEDFRIFDSSDPKDSPAKARN